MYCSKLKIDENPDDFSKIIVDDKVFYYLKPEESISKLPKKRYSDQFKDSLFIAKDTYKKLKIIKQFSCKYKDISQQTEKYISCIEEAIWMLKKDFLIEPSTIFNSFNLKNLGFNPEDYGIEECTNEDNDNFED